MASNRAAALSLAILSPALLFAAAGTVQAATQYRIVPGNGELRILVYRAGLLATLGHNHVVTTRELRGSAVVADAPKDSSVVLEFPVSSLTVDDAAARAEEGPEFSSAVDPDDVDGTRANMLGSKLLDAANHDTVRMESTRVDGELPNLTLTMRILVRGETNEIRVPVSVNTFGDGLVAVGRVRLTHREIGLKPFEAGLGSLRVADEMLVKFRVRAEAVSP